MRFIVYGAGAIGAVVGARLAQAGCSVVLVARGSHRERIRAAGLRVESPDGPSTLDIPVVGHPGEVIPDADDVVLLTMKSQDTCAALRDLAAAFPRDVPVCCLQNGVDNERQALRLFPQVYGVSVACPTAFLEPGVVCAYSAPVPGLLDIGRYPAESSPDPRAETIAAAFRAAGFASEVRPDISRWKHGKLLSNLGNAIEAVCGPPARHGPIDGLARQEARDVLAAAGIDYRLEDPASPRLALIKPRPIGSVPRPGASTWQSLTRRTGSVETAYLNGEIVLLGRLHGVPTPVNELLQLITDEIARDGLPPGQLTTEEFLARLPSAVTAPVAAS